MNWWYAMPLDIVSILWLGWSLAKLLEAISVQVDRRRVRFAFGGWSAGGLGTLYNFHFVLDDMQWPNMAGFVGADLALEDGDPGTGLAALGGLLESSWATASTFPPYCFVGDCAVGPILYQASAPPMQKVLGRD